MTFWGVGPRLFAVTGTWFTATLALHLAMPQRFALDWLTQREATIVGVVLITVGVMLYLPTAWHLAVAVRENRLLTTGLFARIRHPLYAIALWLLTPGVCVLFRSWLVLTTPAAFLLAVLLLINHEEAKLEAKFGDAYRQHRQRTGLLWPRLLP